MLSGGGGNSGVFAPDGKKLTEDADPMFDGLMLCDSDLDQIDLAKAIADPVGHYSRPDLLRLLVDDEPKHYRVKVRKDVENNPLYQPSTTLTSNFKSLEDAVSEHKISGMDSNGNASSVGSDWVDPYGKS